MKKLDVEHILRAAEDLTKEKDFILIGSQSLHGKYPDLADKILMSPEVDIMVMRKQRADKTEILNTIGVDSPFHELFGYYADPVDETTATLPKNWKNRLVHLKIESNTNGAKGYCLEPHDLVVAKLAAAREKDKIFIKALLERDLLDRAVIEQRIAEVPDNAEDPEMKIRMSKLFAVLAGTSTPI